MLEGPVHSTPVKENVPGDGYCTSVQILGYSVFILTEPQGLALIRTKAYVEVLNVYRFMLQILANQATTLSCYDLNSSILPIAPTMDGIV